MKLVIYRDNKVTFQCQAFHSNGELVDLTSCNILQCFKTDQSETNAQALIIKGNYAPYSGLLITDAQHGIFQTFLYPADTQGIPDTIEVFSDVLITDVNGNPFTVGNLTTIEIKANITRK
jgi:hypothetical protein